MGQKHHTIKLYSVQDKPVINEIQLNGYCYSKKAYIEQKYGESAGIFLTAYRWLAKEGARYVPKPEGAELHYWAFDNINDFEQHSGGSVLILDVPLTECLLFNVYDWNKVLKLQYMGENADEERCFRTHIKELGIKHDSDVMLTNFYPELKHEIEKSWQRLFRYHQQLVQGNRPIATIEAALWQIRSSWITDIIE